MTQLKDIITECEETSFVLDNGAFVEGFLVQERVSKTEGTAGYNIYDIRSGEDENGEEIYYSTIEPNVWVDWADSFATKQTLDFGKKGYLKINSEF